MIGVPAAQDLRVERSRCAACHAVNSPWGHLSSFSEESLCALLAPFWPENLSGVLASPQSRTWALPRWPCATLASPTARTDREEPCLACGAALVRPPAPAGLRQVRRVWPLGSPVEGIGPSWIHGLFVRA